MDPTTYRVTVTLTVAEGEYGYNTDSFEKEFRITGPAEVLRQLEIASSVANLYATAMRELDLAAEPL